VTRGRGGFRPLAAALGLATALLGAGSLAAQFPVSLSGGAEITTARLARTGALERVWTGPVMGARGSATFRRFTLEGLYGQGSLTPEAGTLGDGEDLVDGALQLRFQVRPWISVGGGPHLRAYVTPAGSSRWVRFEGRARAEGEIVNGIAFAHFEGWYAFGASTNVQGGGSGAQGGEAGLTVLLPRTPFALALAYTADRANFANGGSEFLEGVRFSVVFAGR